MIRRLLRDRSPAHDRALEGKPPVKPENPAVVKFKNEAKKKRKTG